MEDTCRGNPSYLIVPDSRPHIARPRNLEPGRVAMDEMIGRTMSCSADYWHLTPTARGRSPSARGSAPPPPFNAASLEDLSRSSPDHIRVQLLWCETTWPSEPCPRDFRCRALGRLEAVIRVYPTVRVGQTNTGLGLYPSPARIRTRKDPPKHKLSKVSA